MADVVKNYVKFMRGTPTAFNNLANKDDDTLYFISVEGEEVGQLWIGNKLITMSTSADELATYLNELQDVDTSGVENGNFLGWDEENQLWVPKSLADTLSELGGLVDADQTTIISDDNNVLSLKDFGKVYYRFVAEERDDEGNITVEAGYVKQEVDADHPWKEGLEPRVALENETLVLGWYEPNSSDIDALNERVTTLEAVAEGLDSRVDEVEADIVSLGASISLLGEELGDPATDETEASGIYALINQKADIENVYSKLEADKIFATKGTTLKDYNIQDAYTKEEVETYVTSAVLNVNHLKRIKVSSVEAIDPNAEKADQYIYMVPVSNEDLETSDRYDEYMVIDGQVEKVGSWKVDLSEYLTIESFNTSIANYYNKSEIDELVNDVKEDLATYITATDTRIENLEQKLNGVEEGAEVNVINSVSDEFRIVTDTENNIDRRLELVAIDVTKVTDLENLLNAKADKETVNKLIEDVQSNAVAIETVSTKVNNLEASLQDYIDRLEFEAKMTTVEGDINTIKEILTWKSMG